MQFNFSEIVLLLGAGQGVFLALVFIFSRDSRNANSKLLFAFILLITSWHLFVYSLSISGNIVQVPHLSLTSRPLLLLIGPFYYFYMKFLVNGHLKLKRWDVLHVVPFVIMLLLTKDYYLLSGEVKVTLINDWSFEDPISTTTWLYAVGNLIVTSAYFFATYRLIQDEEKRLFDLISDTRILHKVSQLKTMTAGYFLYVIAFLVTLVLLFLFESYTFEIDYGWVLTKTLFIHAIGFIAISQPEIFSAGSIARNNRPLNGSKYEKSGLSDEQAEFLYKRLIRLMDEERPYLDSELTLTTLAEALSVSPNLLSQVINQKSPKNFSGFINQYRVNHTKQLLRQTESSAEKTILEIAMDSGFNTKASFNRNFKKYTGQTPTSFRNSMKLDNSYGG